MNQEPATEAASFAGRTVGNYRIDGLVGAGGMGEVYRGYATHMDRTVAIKVLPRTLATDETARKRFVRETRMAARVVHPYVATVFDVVEDGADVLLVMEYLEGRTLRKVLRDEQPDRERVLQIGTEIAEALQAIHDKGLVHRDLKPGNVMIAPNGHVKVMDFGVARVVEGAVAEEEKTLTREGFQVGTVQYMSPEQVRGRPVDARSDLFALGGLLWEAITGEHPFSRNTVVETATAILNEPPGGGTEPPSLTESGALRDVVQRLLRKHPDERYASAEAVLDDLRAVARGERPSRTDAIERVHRRRRTTVVATAFVAGAIATALIVTAVVMSPWRAPPPVVGVVQDARPLVVVLPFDAPGREDDPSSLMATDLLAAILGDGSSVRTAPTWRVEEILHALGKDASRSRRFERVRETLQPRFILAGSVYVEDDDWIASVDVVDGATLASLSPLQVRADRASDLASRIASRVPEAIGIPAEADASGAGQAAPVLPEIDEALEWFARARRHDRRLEWVDARAALERALAIEEDFLDAHVLLADVLGKMGYERDARKTIRDAAGLAQTFGLDDAAPQALRLRAVQVRLTDPEAEVEALSAVVQRFPDDPEARLALSRALRRIGDLDGSLAEIDTATRLDASDGRVWLARAETMRRLGRDEDSREARDRAERLFREYELTVGLAELLQWDALVAWFDDRLEDAAELYERAGERFDAAGMPARAAGARQYRGDAFLMLRRDDEARQVYVAARRVLDEAGHYRRAARIRNSGAALLLQARKIEPAITEFVEALDRARSIGIPELELDPLLNLAFVRSQIGETALARESARQARTIAEDLDDVAASCVAGMMFAIALGEDGGLSTAVDALRAVAEDENCPAVDRTDAWSWASWMAWRGEHPERALEAITNALQLSESSYPASRRASLMVDSARVLVELGRFDAAIARLDEAADLAGDRALNRQEVAGTADAVRLAVSVLAGKIEPDASAPDIPVVRFGIPAWNRLTMADWYLARGEARRASEVATSFANDPWTSVDARAKALVVEARAATATGDRSRAVEAARAAAVEAERLDLPWTEAWACSLLASEAIPRPGDADWRERAIRARDRFFERISTENRASLARRTDWIELTERLGNPGSRANESS